MDTQFQELDSLQRTLNHAIDTFRKELIAANLPALSSQATEPHPLDDNNYLAPTRLYEARRLAIASIVQLKNLLQYPFEKASEDAYAVYDRACVDVMISTGLADCLGKAPDRKKGLHVDDLQKELDMDGRKLTIVLRYLCTQGWVRETQEGVFALNRIGNELLEGSLGRGRLGSPYVPELAGTLVKWLQHPEWKYSDSVLHTPVQIVHKTDLSCFDWVKTRPDLFPYLSEAMRAAGNAYIRGLLTDYPWGSLEGQTIVDCGGGTGAMSIALAKTFPSLRFIIQDLPETLTLAKAQVGKLAPQAAAEGRIMTEFQDFFQPQCRKGDDYHYLFRHVLHDWPDDDATKILTRTAEAAGPKSKIFIMETVSIPGIIDTSEASGGDDAALNALNALNNVTYEPVSPPPFIPANLGAASKHREGLVIQLLSLFNAQGRTLADWKRLAESSGLKLVKVYSMRADMSVIECALPAQKTCEVC